MTKRSRFTIPLIVAGFLLLASCVTLNEASSKLSSSSLKGAIGSSDKSVDLFEEEGVLSPSSWILGSWTNEDLNHTVKFSEDNIIIDSGTSIMNFKKMYGDTDKYKLDEDKSVNTAYIVFINNIKTGQNPIIYNYEKISDTEIGFTNSMGESSYSFIKQ